MLDRSELIDLIQNRYFGCMDKRRLDDTLQCLAPDCVWNMYPAGTRLSGRDSEIRSAFETAYRRYPTMWHGNFEWIVDEAAQRVAAIFDVRLVDGAGAETELSNTKLFQVADGRFIRLDLYFSSVVPVIE